MNQPKGEKPTFTVIAIRGPLVETVIENTTDGPLAHSLALGKSCLGGSQGQKLWPCVLVVSGGKVEGRYPI